MQNLFNGAGNPNNKINNPNPNGLFRRCAVWAEAALFAFTAACTLDIKPQALSDPRDAGITDVNKPDSNTGNCKKDCDRDGKPDVGSGDIGLSDAGSDAEVGVGRDAGPDTGPRDAGQPDVGVDAGEVCPLVCPTDAGPGDAGPTDTGPGDAGPGDAGGPVIVPYCSDPDGLDISVSATTEAGNLIDGVPTPIVIETDECIDAANVREFGCEGSELVESILPCPVEQDCEEGFCATRLPNPVLHLTFNEVDGATAFDLSGNGNNGTLSPDGAFWDPDGRINGTIYFDGTGGVTVLDSPSLTPVDQITMAAWFKMLVDFPEGSANNIFGKTLGVGTGGRQGWGLATIYYWGDTVRPITSLGLESGPGPNTLDSTTELITDTWYHFVATYDGDSVRLFINSVNTVTEIRGADTIYNPLVDLVIGGAVADVANNFNGVIDDLRVYNVALTPEQILVLYNAGLGTEVTRPVMP